MGSCAKAGRGGQNARMAVCLSVSCALSTFAFTHRDLIVLVVKFGDVGTYSQYKIFGASS